MWVITPDESADPRRCRDKSGTQERLLVLSPMKDEAGCISQVCSIGYTVLIVDFLGRRTLKNMIYFALHEKRLVFGPSKKKNSWGVLILEKKSNILHFRGVILKWILEWNVSFSNFNSFRETARKMKKKAKFNTKSE